LTSFVAGSIISVVLLGRTKSAAVAEIRFRRDDKRLTRAKVARTQGGNGMANLLSVNGQLRGMFYSPGKRDERSTGYEPVGIGKPLVVRYLSFFIRFPGRERANELMISTFVKTAQEKAAAAEAINYFNEEAKFEDDTFRLTDFGAECYGHELCYYTKSYLGESIRLTTRIMELDNVNQDVVEGVKSGVTTLAGLPAFAAFMPYAGTVQKGVELIALIFQQVNKDDVIVRGHDLDLHFHRNHARRLQSGRVVCIPGQAAAEFVPEEGEPKYELTPDNRLVAVGTGKEYQESTYYVLQINSETNRLYENFDHFQRAAELLEMTNRGGNPLEFVEATADILKAYNDVDSMRQINALALDDTEEAQQRIKALHKLMSPDMQLLYREQIKSIVRNQEGNGSVGS